MGIWAEQDAGIRDHFYQERKALDRLRKTKPCPLGHCHVLYQSKTTGFWQTYCLISWREGPLVDPIGDPDPTLVRLQFKDHSNPQGFEVPLRAITLGISQDLMAEIQKPIEVKQ